MVAEYFTFTILQIMSSEKSLDLDFVSKNEFSILVN